MTNSALQKQTFQKNKVYVFSILLFPNCGNNRLKEITMVLKCTPPPEFFICWKKVFAECEEHVTRIYRRSVLILMLEGELSFKENGQKITLRKGEYYIQKQLLLQEGLPLSTPPVYYYVEFGGSFGDGDGLSLRGEFDVNRITALADKLYRSCRSGEGDMFSLHSQMMKIFAELNVAQTHENSTAHLVKKHIESEYASKITLDSISRKFGYTEEYITRLFKKEFGITPHSHLISVRLEQAMWLLENTDLSVERISSAVGYGDFSSFWRAFRQKYSQTPGEIRRHGASADH